MGYEPTCDQLIAHGITPLPDDQTMRNLGFQWNDHQTWVLDVNHPLTPSFRIQVDARTGVWQISGSEPIPSEYDPILLGMFRVSGLSNIRLVDA